MCIANERELIMNLTIVPNVKNMNYNCSFNGVSYTISKHAANSIREIKKNPTPLTNGALSGLLEDLNDYHLCWEGTSKPYYLGSILDVHISEIVTSQDSRPVAKVYLHTKSDDVIDGQVELGANLNIREKTEVDFSAKDSKAAQIILKHVKDKEPSWIKMCKKAIFDNVTKQGNYELEPRK